MRIFVAGGTGVLGRRVVRLLVAGGHEVTAMARTPEKAAALRTLGATPVTVDLFDAIALTDAVAGHAAVLNLATHIPSIAKGGSKGAWSENDRIRTEGSRNLVDAAVAAGAHRYIQESIALLYGDAGERWIDETSPLHTTDLTASALVAEANAARFTDAGGVGVILRFAMFYGSDTSHTVDQLRLARQGIAPSVGSARSYQTMIHIDDAASAVVAALDAPAGVYNVAEDRPATRADQAAAIAAALGAPPLWHPPALVAKAGGDNTAHLGASQRVSNMTFREATGWSPTYPDPWSGWVQVVGAVPARPDPRGRRLLVRASLAVLGIQAAVLGCWATLAPMSFYRSFPGGGRHWVAVDGPYNHHMVTDIGALSLGLLVVTIVAFSGRSRAMVRTAGAAWVVAEAPHLLYHLTHRHGLSTGDQIASLSGLALEVVLGVVLVFAAPPPPAAASSRRAPDHDADLVTA